MKKIICFLPLLTAIIGRIATADSSVNQHEKIQTVAGTLEIDAVEFAQDSSYRVKLNGKSFDELHGTFYLTYQHKINSKVDRMLISDYVNGDNVPPLVSLYDFTENPPVSNQVGDELSIADVEWPRDKEVRIKLDGMVNNGKWRNFKPGKWFEFDGKNLTSAKK